VAGETVITVVGNLTADPEFEFTKSGAAWARFTVANNPRFRDQQSGEWKNGEPVYMRCNAWREHAENIAETVTRGMRVIVQGRLRQRTVEKDGQKRTYESLEVDEIGPALRYATATISKKNGSRAAVAADEVANGEDPWAGQEASTGEAPF
jgi:single-strand DNA-binding protein